MTRRRNMVDGQHVDSGVWEARGPIRVFASGDATVNAEPGARVWASGNALVYTGGPGTVAADHVMVSVNRRGGAVCIDGAYAHAYSEARIELRGLGSAYSQVRDQSRVLAHGRVVLFVFPGFRGRVELHDRSRTSGTPPLPANVRRYRP